jgi:Rieske Fe-S protein
VDEVPSFGRPVTRRNFIVWWLAGLLTAFTLAILAPILVYIFPASTTSQKQKKTISLTQSTATLQEGQGIAFSAPPEFGFVMTDGGGDNYSGKISFNGFLLKVQNQLVVVSATCSHLGCTIALATGANHFTCPCHGSEFNLSGQVIHGPAAAPLSHYNWQTSNSPNEIVVEGVALPGIG